MLYERRNLRKTVFLKEKNLRNFFFFISQGRKKYLKKPKKITSKRVASFLQNYFKLKENSKFKIRH